ncbi:Ig-like domain-containing protein [Acidobacteriota bacterium]
MKQIIKVFLLIFALVILSFSSKSHATNQVLGELDNNLNTFVEEEVLSLFKSDSILNVFKAPDLGQEKSIQEKKRLQQKPSSKPHEVGLGDLPLFQINVEQDGHTYYLNEIRLKVELVPRPGVTAAVEAAKDRTIYFMIDGIFIGKAKGKPYSTKFVISAEGTLKYGFKPGKHTITALAAHDGTIVMGNGILNVDKGNVKISETTSNLSSIYFTYQGQKRYSASHSEGDIITVSARFTDSNHPDIPVVGAKVYFRNHAVVLCEARTDANGEALFSYKLTRASMLPSKHTWTFHEGRPLSVVKSDFNFFIEENGRYKKTTDWGLVYRTMCACPQGYTRSKSDRTCIKK